MNLYIETKSHTSTTLELQAWLVPPGLLSEYEDFFGLLVATIEANTDYFIVNSESLSKSNPILPKALPSGTVFFDYPALYYTTENDLNLFSFEVQPMGLPVILPTGESQFIYYAVWNYRIDDPPIDPTYLLPYNNEEHDAGGGQTYCTSSFPQNPSSYDLPLLRWFTDQTPPLYRYIVEDKATWLHYKGSGVCTFEDYAIILNDIYYMYAETTPPAQPSYTGGNVWNISTEFSDAIDIDTDGYSYYYLFLGGCSHITWRTVLCNYSLEPSGPSTPPWLIALPLLFAGDLFHVRLGSSFYLCKRPRLGVGPLRGMVGSDMMPIGSNYKPLGGYKI